MIDLGPHTAFILASYGIAALVIGALTAWIVIDRRSLARELDLLEARGILRRSARGREG